MHRIYILGTLGSTAFNAPCTEISLYRSQVWCNWKAVHPAVAIEDWSLTISIYVATVLKKAMLYKCSVKRDWLRPGMRGKIFKLKYHQPDKSWAMVVGAGLVYMSSSAPGISGASDVEGCSASGGLPEKPCSGLLMPVPDKSLSIATISMSNMYFVI